eukprot:CFRG1008T1
MSTPIAYATHKNGLDLLKLIWKQSSSDTRALDSVRLTGQEAFPSSFRVGALAQSSIAACALAAIEFHISRGGSSQTVTVDMLHAEIEFNSSKYLVVKGLDKPPQWDTIAGLYECRDGRWVRLHTNFDHHKQGILHILMCDNDRNVVSKALKEWNAYALEDAAANAGVVAFAARTREEWEVHEQCMALSQESLVSIERIDVKDVGEALPKQRLVGKQPLSGVRVLDLTRIIAGPVSGRALAAHGADVLRVTSPKLPFIPTLVIDTGRGKRSAYIDLKSETGKEKVQHLVQDADVFIQGYRPGSIEKLGFDEETVARLSPGIVYVSLNAWGYTGPWRNRRGFDSLVQCASGISLAEAAATGSDTPGQLPFQALDHAAGYLMAYGAIRALERQSKEGGSWVVRVSLGRVGRFLDAAGRISAGHSTSIPCDSTIQSYLAETESGFGPLNHVTHAAQLSGTPAKWHRPSTPLGAHTPDWQGFQ